jgi:hypothetical protein
MARYPATLPVAAPTKLTVRAIAGTRVILLALNCPQDQTKDLMGFAFKRAVAGSSATTNWLKGIKVFKSLCDLSGFRPPVGPGFLGRG